MWDVIFPFEVLFSRKFCANVCTACVNLCIRNLFYEKIKLEPAPLEIRAIKFSNEFFKDSFRKNFIFVDFIVVE